MNPSGLLLLIAIGALDLLLLGLGIASILIGARIYLTPVPTGPMQDMGRGPAPLVPLHVLPPDAHLIPADPPPMPRTSTGLSQGGAQRQIQSGPIFKDGVLSLMVNGTPCPVARLSGGMVSIGRDEDNTIVRVV